MKTNVIDKVLNILLLVGGLFFLLIGCVELGDDPGGVFVGFGTGLPLAAVYVWRKLRQSRGKSVKTGLGTILLFLAALFFLMIGTHRRPLCRRREPIRIAASSPRLPPPRRRSPSRSAPTAEPPARERSAPTAA